VISSRANRIAGGACYTYHLVGGIGRRRQEEIYLGPLRGQRQEVPAAAGALEERARKSMSRRALAYIAGGAGLESTIDANRAAFERLRIVPRMLHDVAERDTSVELFSRRLESPFLLAPIGVLELAHRDGDLAVARAAAAEGVPAIFSNQASVAMEDCAQAMGSAPRWLQLYWSTSNELVASFVGRAETCGCEAIVVTLDTTILNVAIPTIARDLHTELASLQWVIAGYSLTLGSLLIIGGRIGDLVGPRRAFTAGAIVFAAGSLLASMATRTPRCVIRWSQYSSELSIRSLTEITRGSSGVGRA
jgi:hypothetical protein